MKKLRFPICASVLLLVLSTTAFPKTGTISTTRTGTISTTRTGTISTTRSGTISTTRRGTISTPSMASSPGVIEGAELWLLDLLLAVYVRW